MDAKFLKELEALDLKALRNKGMKVVAQMDDLRAKRTEKKDWEKEDERQWEQWNSECDAIEKEIRFKEKKEAFEAREADERKPKSGNKGGWNGNGDTFDKVEFDPNFNPNQRDYNRVITKIQTRGRKKLNEQEARIADLIDREVDAFQNFFSYGLNAERLSDEERTILKNAQSRIEQRVGAQSLTTTAGGYLVPQGFIPDVVRSLKFISSFFDEFQVPGTSVMQPLFYFVRTDAGNDLPIPTGDDTSNTGELLAENSDGSSSTADLVFGQKTFKAYKYSTKMIKSSTELLQDSAIDVPAYIADMFGSRLGRILNTHFTTGDNSSKPQGIITGATLGKVAGTSSTISFPEVIDLIHSVDASYRKRPTVRFMFHDKILAEIKKLPVASTYNGRPLWAPGWDQTAPSTIDGYQYLINNDMDSTKTTGKKMMLFGDMKGYGVRFVNQLRMLRLNERYAEYDQVAWIGFLRADGRMLNSSALKYYSGT